VRSSGRRYVGGRGRVYVVGVWGGVSCVDDYYAVKSVCFFSRGIYFFCCLILNMAATFDALSAVVEVPNGVLHVEETEQVIARLRQRLERLPAEQLRHNLDAVYWLCLCCEELITRQKAGMTRKEIVMRLMGDYWSDAEALGRTCDWLCAHSLIARKGVLKRLLLIVKKWVEFKLTL
jgi:hypothetical protein